MFDAFDLSCNPQHWACIVGRTLRDLLARYTNTSNKQSIMSQYGRWYQKKKMIAQ